MKRFLLLIATVFLTISGLQSQDYYVIDSLRERLASASGREAAELSSDLAWEYRKSHPDSTIYFCREVLTAVDNNERDPLYAKAMNFLGVAYHYKGDDVEAYAYYDKALKAGLQSDSIQLGHALNNLGRFYMYQGDYLSSYENYNQALNIFEIKKDRMSMSYAYKSMAELYMTQDRADKALEMAQRALVLRRSANNIRGQVSILNEMAEIDMHLKDYDNALKNYEEAMILSTGIQDDIMTARIHLGIANLFFEKNQFENSLSEVKKANAISNRLDNQALVNEINLQFGKVHYQLGDLVQAEEFLNSLMKVVQNSQDLSVERSARYYLAQIYRLSGRYELAFQNFQRHHQLDKVLESTANARQIERLEARIEIESTNRENELLLLQQEADEAIKLRLRMQNILLTGGILMAFAIVLILYIMYKKRMEANRKLVEKNNHIADQREEIRKQNEKIAKQNNILTAHNAELANLNTEKDTLMNILAHDLKAPFNRIKGLVQLCQLTELNGEQKKYVNMLDNSALDGLNLIRDLLEVSAFSGHEKQPVIKEISLKDHLVDKKDMFKTEAESKHIDISVSLEADVKVKSDPSYMSRILDNLISNAIKFSNPGSEVILSGGKKTNGQSFFSVKDFGPGFSPQDRENLYHKFSKLSAQPTAGESSNGLGLAIVKMLVDNLNAEIELVTAPGEGSEFIISFPDSQEIFQSN